jgi:hypothetical protein
MMRAGTRADAAVAAGRRLGRRPDSPTDDQEETDDRDLQEDHQTQEDPQVH